MARARNSQEENDPVTGDIIEGLFDMLFGTPTGFTFLISVDTPATESNRSGSDRNGINRSANGRNISGRSGSAGTSTFGTTNATGLPNNATVSANSINNEGVNSQPNNPVFNNNNTPLFVMARSLFRIANSNQPDNPSFQSPHFLDYIQDIFANLQKRERVKKHLLRNKPYVFKKGGEEPTECPVCLNDFKPRERIRKLDCEHVFHKKCVDKWLLEGNPCCPMCRKEPFIEK